MLITDTSDVRIDLHVDCDQRIQVAVYRLGDQDQWEWVDAQELDRMAGLADLARHLVRTLRGLHWKASWR